jgi:hypothetical protein
MPFDSVGQAKSIDLACRQAMRARLFAIFPRTLSDDALRFIVQVYGAESYKIAGLTAPEHTPKPTLATSPLSPVRSTRAYMSTTSSSSIHTLVLPPPVVKGLLPRSVISNIHAKLSGSGPDMVPDPSMSPAFMGQPETVWWARSWPKLFRRTHQPCPSPMLCASKTYEYDRCLRLERMIVVASSSFVAVNKWLASPLSS